MVILCPIATRCHAHRPRPRATPTGHAHWPRPLATSTLNFHCFGNFMSHCDQVPRPQATPTSHAHRPRPQATPTKLSLYVYTAEFCLLTYFSRIFICGTLYYFMSRIIFADFCMRDIMLLYVPHKHFWTCSHEKCGRLSNQA